MTYFHHSPSRILSDLLKNLTSGFLGGVEFVWYSSHLPDAPDNSVTVISTTGVIQGRLHFSGEVVTFPGVQFLIRSQDEEVGSRAASDLAEKIDQSVYREEVEIDGRSYLVHAVTRTSDVIPLGPESPSSRRRLYSLNAIATIRPLEGTGTGT